MQVLAKNTYMSNLVQIYCRIACKILHNHFTIDVRQDMLRERWEIPIEELFDGFLCTRLITFTPSTDITHERCVFVQKGINFQRWFKWRGRPQSFLQDIFPLQKLQNMSNVIGNSPVFDKMHSFSFEVFNQSR